MVHFTRMYRHVLLDHHSLIWLLSFRCPQDHLALWLEELSQYHMVIQHRPGRRHCNADALSHLPVLLGSCGTRLDVHPSDLPCGGCPKCKRAHDNSSSTSTKRETLGVSRSSLRRLPATPGSRSIQERVRGITAPLAEALGIPGALYPTALAAPER